MKFFRQSLVCVLIVLLIVLFLLFSPVLIYKFIIFLGDSLTYLCNVYTNFLLSYGLGKDFVEYSGAIVLLISFVLIFSIPFLIYGLFQDIKYHEESLKKRNAYLAKNKD